MLELSAAPTPSPVIAPATPAAPSSPAAAGNASAAPESAQGSGGSEDSSGTPFATVLQGHLKQGDKAAATDGAKPKADAVALVAEAAPEAPVDALAQLAPMLPGLLAAQAAKPAATDGDGAKSATGEDAQAADTGNLFPIAAPITVAADKTANLAGEQGEQPKAAADTLGMAAGAKPQVAPSAILAAEAGARTESSADTGKSGSAADSFASLLDAARGTQLANNHGTQTHAAATTQTAATTVSTPVGARGWSEEVGEKLTWMAGRQETRAELVLNPPQLGRIEVSLTLNGDQANAVFVSASPTVRDALENAVPRLREILQDAGISLGQTQVGAESFQQSANNSEKGDNSWRGGRNDDGADNSAPGTFASAGSSSTQWLRRGNGLVDTFA